MIHNFREPGTLTLPTHPTVVIGSGPAGLAIALALADAGEDVVMLESGGLIDDAAAARESARLNEAVQTGMPVAGVTEGRARMIGGTGSLWHGQCMRMHDIDFAHRPWVERSGWPIAAGALSEHYDAAERFFDVSGRGYGPTRWQDHQRLEPLAWDDEYLLHDFTEYSVKPHVGREYWQQVESHARLHLVLHATASRVLVKDGRTVGVEIKALDRPAAVIEARRIVLACGGIENARLLMLSDPARVGLGDGREHTGRYYQDHPIVRTAKVVAKDYRLLQDRYIALYRDGRRLFPKVRLSPRAQQEHGLVDATAVFFHEHDDPNREALRRLIFAARYRRRPDQPLKDAMLAMGAPGSVLRDVYRRYAKGLATGARPAAVWLQIWLEQRPDPDSRVTIGHQTDPLGMAQARLHWTCADQEIRTSRLMTRWIGQDLERLGLARLEEAPGMTDDDAWRRSVRDASHPAGTTRMADSPRDGVVDTDLQVHGVDGLFVLGSSVFPICGYANPTLTIVALAYRLAAHLRGSAARPGPRAEPLTSVAG